MMPPDQDTAQTAAQSPFADAIHEYADRITSLYHVFPGLVYGLQHARDKFDEEHNAFLEKHGTLIAGGDETAKRYTIRPEHGTAFRRLAGRLNNFRVALPLFPRTMLVELVSQYDAFLGRLIRCIYYSKPEILNASEKTITFSDLQSFSTVADAREHIIETEVEAVLRKSHADHFTWLENKLEISLRKNLEVWPAFVELTERRNLFVHCDGKVSSQYLKVCGIHKVVHTAPVPAQGAELWVSKEYFEAAYAVLLELGVKLGQVLWRKLAPDEVEDADYQLNDIALDLIHQEEYDVAISLLSFAVDTLSRKSTEEMKLIYRINLAQAHKWKGDEVACRKLVDAVDWSALSDKLRLGAAVLRDDFSEAAKLTKRIGANNDLSERNLLEWPLFRKYREHQEFVKVYAEVFGHPPPLPVASPAPGLEEPPSSESSAGVLGHKDEGLDQMAAPPESGAGSDGGAAAKACAAEGGGSVDGDAMSAVSESAQVEASRVQEPQSGDHSALQG